MNQAIAKLVRVAAKLPMTEAERDEQRIRFSFGSAKIENEHVTEQMVRDAARDLKAEADKRDG